MSLDPQIDALLKQLAEGGGSAPESQTVRENRALASSLATLAGDPEAVSSVHDTVAAAEGIEVPVRSYIPAGVSHSGQLPVTVFFHGGRRIPGGGPPHAQTPGGLFLLLPFHAYRARRPRGEQHLQPGEIEAALGCSQEG
jgi:acetyl esterase/lipase